MEIKEPDIDEAAEKRIREQYRTIGRRIAYFRRLKGYTQVQMAEKMGLSSNYLSQIECGKREKYSLHTLMLATMVLEVSLKDLCE